MKAFRQVLLCVAPAVLAWLVPAAHGSLLYDRAALLHGEWWRLWTGHWVHFTASHLGWNVLALAGAGLWLERLQPGSLLRYVLVAAPVLSLAFLIGEPAMHTYGGLSGLATGTVVLLALTQGRRNPAGRAWWIGGLALVALKLGVEATHASPLFVSFDSHAIQASACAHIAGAAIAVAFFLSRRPASSRVLARQPAVDGTAR